MNKKETITKLLSGSNQLDLMVAKEALRVADEMLGGTYGIIALLATGYVSDGDEYSNLAEKLSGRLPAETAKAVIKHRSEVADILVGVALKLYTTSQEIITKQAPAVLEASRNKRKAKALKA